jgi:hypothetical protein
LTNVTPIPIRREEFFKRTLKAKATVPKGIIEQTQKNYRKKRLFSALIKVQLIIIA